MIDATTIACLSDTNNSIDEYNAAVQRVIDIASVEELSDDDCKNVSNALKVQSDERITNTWYSCARVLGGSGGDDTVGLHNMKKLHPLIAKFTLQACLRLHP